MTGRLRILLAALACLTAASGASADEVLEADARFAGERLVFTVTGTYSNYVLTVAGPETYYARAEGARTAPTLRLRDHGAVPDGIYTWELSAATNRILPGAERMDQSANGREPGSGLPRVGARTSGMFRVQDGRIMVFEDLEEPAPGAGLEN